MSTTETAIGQLKARLTELGSVLVCFSGGVDSACLLALAHQTLGAQAVGMTAVSPSLPQLERTAATSIAAGIGADHRLVESQEIEDPSYVANNADRCFHCKSELYRVAEAKRQEWGIKAVLNGTNMDDLGDYRPGLEAASQAGVVSPFVELGLSKQNVRDIALSLGLSVWDKPAAACLSSRIPYGTSVTRERLRQIDGFETALKQLGFGQLRVRYHGAVARLELDLSELPKACSPQYQGAIVAAGMANGFKYVTLDLAGYRQGSHNEVLVGRSLKVIG